MNSNEEYLDNLLKSMQDKENEAAAADTTADDVAAIFDGLTDEPAPAETEVAPPTSEELSAMSESEIADILSSMNNPTPEDNNELSDEALMADAMKDSAIAEINELLYKNDNDEYVEPDPEEPAPPKKGGKKEKEPKEKKGLFSRFGRKKEEPAPVVEEETPLTIEEPVVEETPAVEEEMPLTIEEPIIEEPEIEETPIVEEETPLTIEEPVIEEAPVVVEEMPLTIEEPVIEEAPVVEEEIPLTIEEPVIEEEAPLTIEEPIIEEAPVVEEEIPLTIEEPVIEEAPAVEEEAPAAEETPAESSEESSDEATLESMFGDFFIEPSSEQKEYVEEPVVDLDDGLAELLSIAGVTEDDFKGETDENAAPKPAAEEPAEEETAEEELSLDDITIDEPASEEASGEEAPAEEAPTDEAPAADGGVTLDSGLFGGMDNLGLDFGNLTEENTESGEAGNPEDLLFASIDEVQETATPVSDSDGMEDLMGLLGEAGEEASSGESAEDIPEKGAKAPKKKGGFLKMMEFLTESDDDDEEEEGGKFSLKDLFKKKKKDAEPSGEENPTGADAEGATTDENKEVNRQLDAEEEDGKKKKKKKKRKKGEPEGAEELEEREPHERQAGKDDEESEEGGDGKKGKKKKKEKKKKEPKPVDNRPLPKLSKKKVRATFCFALTILAAILICVFFLGDVVSKQKARSAFYKGDYEECYRNFYGKKLTEGDENMFKKAELLLYLERNKERYYEYMAIDDEYHALDSLLDAVLNKDAFMQKASMYGFDAEATNAYNEILSILETSYGLSEEDAMMINSIDQDAVYTLYVHSIVDGTDFVIPDYLQDGYFEERVNALMNGEEITDNEQFEDSDN